MAKQYPPRTRMTALVVGTYPDDRVSKGRLAVAGWFCNRDGTDCRPTWQYCHATSFNGQLPPPGSIIDFIGSCGAFMKRDGEMTYSMKIDTFQIVTDVPASHRAVPLPRLDAEPQRAPRQAFPAAQAAAQGQSPFGAPPPVNPTYEAQRQMRQMANDAQALPEEPPAFTRRDFGPPSDAVDNTEPSWEEFA